jgi:microcin C transport system permease protein
VTSQYRGAQGLDPEFIAKLEAQFGFDKPPLERFGLMMWNYIRFDFGESYFRSIDVIDLIIEKLPVSISLGVWMTAAFLRHLDSAGDQEGGHGRFPLRCLDERGDHRRLRGARLPVRILLIVLFAGGSFFDWFPLRGLTSDNLAELSCSARSWTISGTWRCP